MKKKFSTFFLASILLNLLLISCQKKLSYSNLNIETASVKVENGHLVFKDYDVFYNTMILLSSMNPKSRKEWERSLSFKSFASYVDDFNQKMNLADSLTDVSLFQRTKMEYSDIIIYSKEDSSFKILAPGAIEANIISRNKVVKIGNDYLLYHHSGFNKYENKTWIEINKILETENRTGNIRQRIVYGSAPSSNNYTVTISGFKTTSSNEGNNGRFHNRLKLYNLNSTSSGNRGFLSIEYFAEHRNWLGIYRQVENQIHGVQHRIFISYSNNTSAIVDYNKSTSPYLTETLWDPRMSSWQEKILIISSYLKNNVLSSHPLSSYLNNNASIAVKEVNDDAVSSAGGYWNYIATVYGPAYLRLVASSLGTGPLADLRSYDIIEN